MSDDTLLRRMIDTFFLLHPHRAYFVFTDGGPESGVNTFFVVTREFNFTAFDRITDDTAVPAAALAHWFSDTNEGQQAIQKFVAGLTEEIRAGGEVEARGELILMTASLTAH
ncbi:hypothetical protein IAG25_40620 [Caballeronia sp. EK]|uniref:hypothetical protein n=1 Tax=Caballeronia sp. EK TaxID=2767469 RepID=UPI001655FF0A|nr:hypothetical protein [Caballeronia sp. EK]MBC8643032.1 hypothetical protein [Caballeronia sp. EK]